MMGCQSVVIIGDNLTFSVTTHDPDTGGAVDADSVPTYRVYEDETGTPILTGSMAKLDDAGTTGFYTELIACTSGNGFENGKTYTVYIEATVDTVIGCIAYSFRAVDVAAEYNRLADYILRRAFASAAASADGDTKDGRSLLGAVAKLVNKLSISGATLSIHEADDTTVLFQQTLSTDSGADPIVGIDTI